MDSQHLISTQDPMVLQMMYDTMRQIQEQLSNHQRSTQDEFRRLQDRMEGLRSDVQGSLSNHSTEIAILEEKAKVAGRISGYIAGTLSSVVVGVIIALAKYFLLGE